MVFLSQYLRAKNAAAPATIHISAFLSLLSSKNRKIRKKINKIYF
jgi:hypothetical protein